MSSFSFTRFVPAFLRRSAAAMPGEGFSEQAQNFLARLGSNWTDEATSALRELKSGGTDLEGLRIELRGAIKNSAPASQLDAAILLSAMGEMDEEVRQTVLRALADRDPLLRGRATAAIWNSPKSFSDALPLLIDDLSNEHPASKELLVRLGGLAAPCVCLALKSDWRDRVRRRAAAILGGMRERYARGSDPEAHGLQAFVPFRDEKYLDELRPWLPEIFRELIAACKDRSPPVRVRAIRALGYGALERIPSDVLPAYLECMRSANHWDFISALKDLLSHPEADTAKFAETYIGALSPRERFSLVSKIICAPIRSKDPNPEARIRALTRLGHRGAEIARACDVETFEQAEAAARQLLVDHGQLAGDEEPARLPTIIQNFHFTEHRSTFANVPPRRRLFLAGAIAIGGVAVGAAVLGFGILSLENRSIQGTWKEGPLAAAVLTGIVMIPGALGFAGLLALDSWRELKQRNTPIQGPLRSRGNLGALFGTAAVGAVTGLWTWTLCAAALRVWGRTTDLSLWIRLPAAGLYLFGVAILAAITVFAVLGVIAISSDEARRWVGHERKD